MRDVDVVVVPSAQGRLIGREPDVQRVGEALDARDGLVTLLGPGGVGKTRLAQHFSQERNGLFVELAAANGTGAVVDALVSALGLAGRPGAPAARIAQSLDRRAVSLVVLDNVEQLGPDVTDEVGLLVRAAPGVAWLATSRRPLGCVGERPIRLEPLARVASEALFLDRAPGLSVNTDPDRVALERVLARLEGLPLALELAAGRLEVLSLRALADRLDGQLHVLGRPEGQDRRHGSMVRVLDTSWELLPLAARQMLPQLSVFQGDFSLDAVEGVVEVEGAQVLNALHVLVRHSLVVPRAESAEKARFSMLELVREYAALKLTGGARATVESRHLRWFTGAARGWADDTDGPGMVCLRADRANLLAAHARALAGGRPEALALAGLLRGALVETMAYDTYQALVDKTVAAFEPLPPTPDAARTLLCQGYLQLLRRDVAESLETLGRSEAIAATVGDLDLELDAASYATFAESSLGKLEDRKRRLQSIVDRARPGQTQGINAQIRLANLEVWVGRPERATALMSSYASVVSGRRDRLAAFFAYSYARSQGDVGEVGIAETWWRVAVDVATERRVPFVAPEVRSGLAALLYSSDRAEEALRVLQPAVLAARQDPEHHQLTWLISGLIDVDQAQSEAGQAALQIASQAGANNDQGRFQAALAWLGLLLVAVDGDRFTEAAQACAELRQRTTAVPMLRRDAVAGLIDGAVLLADEHADLAAAEAALRRGATGFARLACQAAVSVLARRRSRAGSVRIARSGVWVRAPGEALVDLSRRPTVARVLAFLADSVGKPQGTAALFAGAWAGESATDEAARSRVYVALSTLRKAGVPIRRTAQGYELDGVVVE